jgi:hypothetical protein
MADCYYHGYSGSPGPCPECEEEARRGLKEGTLDGKNVGLLNMQDVDDMWHKRNNIKKPKNDRKRNQ